MTLCESHCREFLANTGPQGTGFRISNQSEGEIVFDLRYLISKRNEAVSVIYLYEAGGSRRLAFTCGPCEAAAIGRAVRRNVSTRPLTHDVMMNMLAAFGATLIHVIIYDHERNAGCYLAKLILQKDGVFYEIDARPSDAVCLATMGAVPILVHEKLLRA